MDSKMPSERLRRLESNCDNAGRWGPDDDLGTLNLITPAVRIRAASLVSEGVTVSLASDLQLPATQHSDLLVSHSIDSEPAVPDAIVDEVTLNVHGWGTHIDALGHFHLNGTTYNNRTVDDILGPEGLRRNAVTAMRDGIFTRGALLDVARTRGVPWLASDEFVTAADLDRAEAATGLTVESGDAVIVHVGLDARLAAAPDADPDVPGVAATRRPAADCREIRPQHVPTDRRPSRNHLRNRLTPQSDRHLLRFRRVPTTVRSRHAHESPTIVRTTQSSQSAHRSHRSGTCAQERMYS